MWHTTLSNTFLDILFPPQCVVCKKKLENNAHYKSICNQCLGLIDIHYGFFCPRCARRLPTPRLVCHQELHYVLGAVGSYHSTPLRELIHALKYNSVKIASEPLTYLLDLYLKNVFSESLRPLLEQAFLIPMPLHKKKERKRGYNQATLIAQKLLSIPEWSTLSLKPLLVKIKHTSSQTECKNYKERARNVAGSFIITHQEEIKGKTIIILDDVFTSGATMHEAALTLRNAGAKNIIALVLAKA